MIKKQFWANPRLLQAILLTLGMAFVLTGCSSSHIAQKTTALPLPRQIPSLSPLPDFKMQIDSFLPDSLFPPSNVGIMVVSLADGRSLYELNPDMLFMPASNEKLFTSAAALSILTPGYRFLTSVSADTADVPTLYLRGTGDPLLTTKDLDSLARVTSSRVSHDKAWLLVGDVSFFDDIPWGEGWMWDDEADPDGMAITSLSLNGNTVQMGVRGGRNPGDTLEVRIEPRTGYVTVENRGVTAVDTIGDHLMATRRPGDPSNTIVVAGTLRPRDTSSVLISVREPAWYTLRVFSERLAGYGVRCTGMVFDTLSLTAHALCTIDHTLDTVVTNMNRVSDNLSAECLLKTIGAIKAGAPGTAPAGLYAIKNFLAQQGVDTTRMVLADGSGVSRYNLTTARGIAGVLQIMYRNQNLFPLFYNSLAAPGEHGSLSGRMRGTAAVGNLRAKTGTLRGASAFSGYVRAADGSLLAFSIIMQNFQGNLRSYRQIQDRIGVFLSNWTK